MRVKRFASNRNTIGPATPHPRIPIRVACGGENGSHTSPRIQRTPVRSISARTAFSSLPPRNTGAASSMESPKNQSQAKKSNACGNGGHPEEMKDETHSDGVGVGWRATANRAKLTLDVMPARRIMKARAARL